MFQKSAYEVWRDEKEAGFIITLCQGLDDAIGGGIRVGSITELVGGPGVGKTQIWWVNCELINVFFSIQNLIKTNYYFFSFKIDTVYSYV